MTRFAQMFKRTGASSLMHLFGETITYLPGAGGRPRPIAARVIRNDPLVVSESGDVLAQSITVIVADDSATGISANEIDSGRDEILVSLKEGGEPERRPLKRVVDTANGQVKFEVL